jgi:hypothetical protein
MTRGCHIDIVKYRRWGLIAVMFAAKHQLIKSILFVGGDNNKSDDQ